MKYIIIILLVFFGLIAKAQLPASTFMSRDFNGNTKADWIILDSPMVNFVGTTTFNARYAGTQFVKIGGGDTAFYFGAGGTLWFRTLLDRDTISLSNRINLKLNTSDTALKWWGIGKRWVDTLYRVNDSTIGYTINNGAQQTFQILGRLPSGGGSGSVTSVALSMPSAFSVSGSPITSSGTFSVSGAGTTAQYIRGNGTLATTDTGMIPSFHLKVRSLFSGTSPITFNQTTGVIGINNANTSGTKGAATFSAAFQDNGSGTIDLLDLGAAGSCTGCLLNIDAKGRITAYSDGPGGATNNANIGAGFRWLNGITQELRTVANSPTITWDSVSTANTLTPKVDTSIIATLFDISQLSVTADNGLTKTGSNIQLGGALTQSTTISTTASYFLNVTGANVGQSLKGTNTSTGTGVMGQSTSGTGVYGLSSSLNGVLGVSITGTGVVGESSSGEAINANIIPSSTNTLDPVVRIQRFSTGTAANGIGGSLEWYTQSTGGSTQRSNRIGSSWSNATTGSRTSILEFYGVNSATEARKAALAGTGQWTWDGYPALTAQTDSTTYKPVAIDGSGNVVKMANWLGSGGSGGAPSLTYKYIGFGGIGNTLSPGEAAFQYDSIINLLTVDSILTKKIRNDSSMYSQQAIPFGRISQINAFGNSITQYLNAVPDDSAYIKLIADTLKAYFQNYALSGMGVFYACQKHDSIVQGPNNNAATTVMAGYNDERVTGAGVRTHKKIASGIKAMFLNHFANMYIPGSTTATDTNLVRYGTWTIGLDAMQWSGKTKNAASTSTINDSIVWKCQPATVVGVNLIAGDSLLYNHSIVELFIDGVSQGEYNTNNIADSAAKIGPVNTRISYAIIIGGLSNTPHTIKLVNKAARIMYVDYFTTLDNKKPSFVIFHNISGEPGGAALQNAGNAAIDSMVLTLPTGFPVLVVKTNNFWSYATGMSGDDVHPNNRGHHQMYQAFLSVYDSALAANGVLQFDGRNLWVSGGGSMQKVLNASDAWTKGDAAMNVAGYVNIPYNMSIKQNGTDVFKTDELLQNTKVGYHAAYLQTFGTGNTAVGHSALGAVTIGGGNTAIGQNSLGSNLIGVNNTAVGYQSAFNNTGDGVTAVGMYALFANSSGSNNTAVGQAALFANINGSDNTAVGREALSSGTAGGENTAMGYRSMIGVTGSGNATLGVHTLESTTTGSYNVALGRYAMFFNTTGTGNIAIGNGALYGGGADGKDYCVALGYGALGGVLGGANGNIGIGRDAGNNISTGINNIIIGYDIDAPSATTNNQLSIGNLIFGTALDGTGTTLSSGNIGIGIAAPVTKLHVNGKLSVNTHTIAANSDSAVVRVLATGEYQYAKINGSSATTIYTGDGTLPADRNIASGGFTLRLSGVNNSDTLMSIINTGTSSTALFANGTLFGIDAQSSNLGIRAFGSVTGLTAEGGTGEGAIIKSDAVRGATIQSVPATTNTVQEVLRIERGVNGSPGANGIGGSINFYNKRTDNASDVGNTIVSKFTDAVAATLTSQLYITGVNSGTPATILTLDGDGSLTTTGKRALAVTTSSAGTLTLGNSEAYIFNGTTTTWTLAPVSGTTGRIYYIKNIGSGSITLNADSGNNEIYSSSAVNTVTVTAGSAIILISNNTFWTVN